MIRLGLYGICVLALGQVFLLINGMFCDVGFSYGSATNGFSEIVVTWDICICICIWVYLLTDTALY